MKKKYLITLIIAIIIFETITVMYSYKQPEQNVIPKDYIAVFKGEYGETVYSTYLYSKKNKKKKKDYYYINTISTLTGQDSTNWQEEVTKKAKLKKKKKIYEIAKKNKADSYIKYEDGKIYSIEDFKKMFR